MSRRRSTDKENRSPGQRQLRVGEEIRHLLADLLERGNMRDPDLREASITVTSVDVSPDLRNAIGLRDAARRPGRTAPARRHAPRRAVVSRPGRRDGPACACAPEIRFELDRTFDEADRIGALLRRPDVARDIKDE